jgi:TRAP-type C4-dicarboxylate transport system permease small subunit
VKAGGSVLRIAFVTVPRFLLGTLMLTAIAINFANVLGRYLAGSALFWAEEILVFITIWGVFVGMAACAYEGRHLNMDLFAGAIEGRAKIVLNASIALAIVACCVFMVVQSFQVVTLFMNSDQVSVAAGIPKAIPHAALAVGFALTALAVIVRIRSYISGKF